MRYCYGVWSYQGWCLEQSDRRELAGDHWAKYPHCMRLKLGEYKLPSSWKFTHWNPDPQCLSLHQWGWECMALELVFWSAQPRASLSPVWGLHTLLHMTWCGACESHGIAWIVFCIEGNHSSHSQHVLCFVCECAVTDIELSEWNKWQGWCWVEDSQWCLTLGRKLWAGSRSELEMLNRKQEDGEEDGEQVHTTTQQLSNYYLVFTLFANTP